MSWTLEIDGSRDSSVLVVLLVCWWLVKGMKSSKLIEVDRLNNSTMSLSDSMTESGALGLAFRFRILMTLLSPMMWKAFLPFSISSLMVGGVLLVGSYVKFSFWSRKWSTTVLTVVGVNLGNCSASTAGEVSCDHWSRDSSSKKTEERTLMVWSNPKEMQQLASRVLKATRELMPMESTNALRTMEESNVDRMYDTAIDSVALFFFSTLNDAAVLMIDSPRNSTLELDDAIARLLLIRCRNVDSCFSDEMNSSFDPVDPLVKDKLAKFPDRDEPAFGGDGVTSEEMLSLAPVVAPPLRLAWEGGGVWS